MELGCFSVSLTVKDIDASVAFYGHLGFTKYAGDCGQGWIILKNGDHVIGLFQGMFEKNLLCFNPGWDQNAAPQPSFTDVRALQATLKAAGIPILKDVGDSPAGPASFMIEDPDGNPILFDQHV